MKAIVSIPSCILFSLALLGGSSVSAGVIYPTSATTTGGTLNPLPTYAVDYLFNEAVTGPGATLDNTVTNHNFACASARPVPGGYPVTIVADFGSAVDLSALYLWNIGNPNKAVALEKGVKDFSLTFWDGPGATGSQVGSVFTASAAQVANFGANQPEIPGQTFTFASSYNGVQSVEFRLINNQVEDTNQWVGVREIAFQPVSEPFVITAIDYAPDADPVPTVTLTWRNSGAASYVAYLSRDLSNWGEDLDDSISEEDDENTEDTEYITVTFPLTGDRADAEELFFRIEEQ